MTLKTIIKRSIPETLLARFRVARHSLSTERFRRLSPQEAFSEIYAKQMWGTSNDSTRPFFSGSGSHDNLITSTYLSHVQAFLSGLNYKPNVVDLGCGDFSVGSKIRPFCNYYIACDIVSALIQHNRQLYANLNVDFRTMNLISDEIPSADIVFVRQVLQHLSNDHINSFLPKLNKFKYLILTEHVPSSDDFVPNLDKVTGPDTRLLVNSGVVVTAPPFNLTVKRATVLCAVKEYAGSIETILYEF